MTLEESLVNNLKTIVKIYPLNAEKSLDVDYATIETISDDDDKSLNGYSGLTTETKEIDIICKKYSSLKILYKQVKDKLKSLEKSTLGEYFIQEIAFEESSPELWEDEINKYRKIITFSISY